MAGSTEGTSILIQKKLSGGYGLFAAEDIQVDTPILLERAFVSFNDDTEGNRCAECHKATISDTSTTVSRNSPGAVTTNMDETAMKPPSTVRCICGEGYCSVGCKEAAAAKYHSALCSTKFKDLEREVVRSSGVSSSRFVCLILKLIAMVSVAARSEHYVDKAGKLLYTTPLDSAHLKLLYRLTDRYDPVLDAGVHTEAMPVGHLIKIDSMLRFVHLYFPKHSPTILPQTQF